MGGSQEGAVGAMGPAGREGAGGHRAHPGALAASCPPPAGVTETLNEADFLTGTGFSGIKTDARFCFPPGAE